MATQPLESVLKLKPSTLFTGLFTGEGSRVTTPYGDIDKQYESMVEHLHRWAPVGYVIRLVLDNPEMRFRGNRFLVSNEVVSKGSEMYLNAEEGIYGFVREAATFEQKRQGFKLLDEEAFADVIAKTGKGFRQYKAFDLDMLANTPWFKAGENGAEFEINQEVFNAQGTERNVKNLLTATLGSTFYQIGTLAFAKEQGLAIKVKLPLKNDRSNQPQTRTGIVNVDENVICFDISAPKNLTLEYHGIGIEPGYFSQKPGFQ